MNREKAKHVMRAIKVLVKQNPRLDLNELRVVVALERAIARLMRSKNLAECLIFKGGFVLLKSYDSLRFTRDADVLATAISKDRLRELIQEALSFDLEDGLWFGDIQVRELTEQGEYGAFRFDCAFQIGIPELKKIPNYSRIHLDVGLSDRLSENPNDQIMPSVLKDEAPVTWRVYPAEYIAAEKIQTLFHRGSANSRAKDVYDLIHLLPRCEKAALIQAIQNTFQNRETPLPRLFAIRANQFDRTILSRGWVGVKMLDEKSDFETSWDILISHFKQIDEMQRSF